MPVLVAHGLAVFLEGNVRSDLEHLKIGAMVGIFGISLFAVSFPGVSKEVSFLRIPHLVFFIGKHFGTGAILSTAFCHLLPDAFDALKDREVNKRYHGIGRWAGLIILGSLLSIFLVEFISTSYVDHLHAKPSAPPSISASAAPSRPKTPPANIIPPALPASFTNHPNHLTSPVQCQSCLQNTNHCSSPTCALASTERTPLIRAPKRAKSFSNFDPRRDEPLLPLILLNSPRLSRPHSGLIWGREIPCICQLARAHEQAGGMHNIVCEEDDTDHVAEDVKPKIGRRRQIVGILVLQLGIMIHSLVIGLTLAVTSGGEFTSLVTAIVFHQLFEGLSLGIRIAALPPPHPPASESPCSSRSSSPHTTGSDDSSHSHHHSKSWPERWLTPTLSILFATTTPFGMMLGALLFTPSKAITSPAESARMHLTQGLMSAISAGMLIYASTVEMLAGDFVFGDVSGDHGHGHAHAHDRTHGHSHEHGHGHPHEHGHDEPPLGPNAMKVLAVCSLLAGSTTMALVGMGE